MKTFQMEMYLKIGKGRYNQIQINLKLIFIFVHVYKHYLNGNLLTIIFYYLDFARYNLI